MTRLAALLLALLLPCGAFAQAACAGRNLVDALAQADPAAHARLEAAFAEIPNGTGHFWRIEKPGLKPSHLFGTAHVSEARALNQLDRIEPALAASDTLLVELDLDSLSPLEMADIITQNSLPEGTTLDDFLSPDEEQALGRLTASHGMPWFSARKLRPALLAVILAVPPCAKLAELRGEKVLDERIVGRARTAGLRVEALETIDEQIAALAALKDDLQLAALVETADEEPGLGEDVYETTLALYAQGTIAKVEPLVEALGKRFPAMLPAYADMREPLIVARNRVMHERALPHVEKGGAFIAVGALHLPGADGLVELFRQSGFTVTPAR